MNVQRLSAALFFFVLVTSGGCGPTLHLSPSFEKVKPVRLAVLPIKHPETLRQQRIAYLENTLLLALKNEGYSLLDPAIVQRVCQSDECEERSALLTDFDADALVQLDLNDIIRSNFGLGYYNTIVGTLRLNGPQGTTLASVQHQESERGGIVFDSGQVIQGIREQIENNGDEAFNSLAQKF
ncbi:MAG: hypothetical protein KDD44_13910, partial [Bdellovibrionales bacterium]|nr:hypothetical protein [Bdellovibrionales bacterium]